MAEHIHAQIISLSDNQKAVFAGLVCERLYPQYEAFCRATNWGSPAVYERGIELLYNSGLGAFHSQEATSLLEKLALVTPALSDFASGLTPFALDACIALEEALRFLTDKQESHMLHCATAAADSVEAFAQEHQGLDPNRRDFEAAVAANPYLQAEIARQHRLTEALLSIHEFDAASIHQLRRLNGSGSIIELARIPA
ncbi:DUF416 family protein [Hymenobacter oligotrophus]|uniref:DUF416 family protein n=1 Tax=Hymenobacter oligotrophus TaxID=2319843 RepID=A0A3B7QZI5_9BACT|nr:DUF416 family protein [Hymenobacter oligotrophus]AYA37284.1 DUF416 family protein [Hymenobacter oligotrophus]